MLQIFQQKDPPIELSERQRAIIAQLRTGDKTLSELRDALGWSYPELDRELASLTKLWLVSYYFTTHMVWRLVAR